MCTNCWDSIKSFHMFYIHIQEVHQSLANKITDIKESNTSENTNCIRSDQKFEQVKVELFSTSEFSAALLLNSPLTNDIKLESDVPKEESEVLDDRLSDNFNNDEDYANAESEGNIII